MQLCSCSSRIRLCVFRFSLELKWTAYKLDLVEYLEHTAPRNNLCASNNIFYKISPLMLKVGYIYIYIFLSLAHHGAMRPKTIWLNIGLKPHHMLYSLVDVVRIHHKQTHWIHKSWNMVNIYKLYHLAVRLLAQPSWTSRGILSYHIMNLPSVTSQSAIGHLLSICGYILCCFTSTKRLITAINYHPLTSLLFSSPEVNRAKMSPAI